VHFLDLCPVKGKSPKMLQELLSLPPARVLINIRKIDQLQDGIRFFGF
jgi:hypothetical protein